MREIVRVLLDGGQVRDSLELELKTPGERVRVVAFYVGQNTDDLQLDYRIKHLAPETTSELLVYGVLADESCKSLRMEIEFCRGAMNARGEEREDVMLLSERVQNRSLPTILCGEESVRGVHGASVGRIDEDALRYLMTRGLDEKTAKKMLIRAKLMQGVGKIEDEKLRKATQKRLEAVKYNYD